MKTFFTEKVWFLLLGLALCGSITAQTKMSNHPEDQRKRQDVGLRQPAEVWDVLYAFDYTEVAGIDGFYAPFYWDGNLYISRWNATLENNEPGKIYKFSMVDGSWSFDNAFVIPDVTGENNFEGFTSDGTYIYGVNETEFIYQIDPANWTVASKIEVASAPISIAYDSDKNGFWIADFIDFTTVFVDMDGTATGESLTFDDEDMYIAGLAYDNISEGGPYLWTSCYTDLHRWDLNSSEFEYNVHSILDVPGTTEDDWNSNIYIYQDIETERFVLLGLDEESYLVYAYDFGAPAVVPPPANLTISADGNNFTISWEAPAELDNPTFNLYKNDEIVLEATSLTSYSEVLTTVNTWCVETIYNKKTSEQVCADNELPNAIAKADDTFKIYPNPAADVLKISGTGIRKLEIYNLAGQLMEEKTNDVTFINVSDYSPGVYNVVIYDGNNTRYSKKIVVSR